MRPLVAVSASTRTADGAERVRLNQAYISAIEGAGLLPVIVPPLQELSELHRLIDAVSGLVLTGGEDVDPSRYSAERHPATGQSHRTRDLSELELARLARARALPTLAICRGVQLLNVALGGTLVQDITSEMSGSETHDGDHARDLRVHDVVIVPESRLARAVGDGRIRVNSIHHQALATVARGLRVTASASDGVVEGVEWSRDDWWALGVQWHPEELIGTPEAWDRRLFECFADACRERAARPLQAVAT